MEADIRYRLLGSIEVRSGGRWCGVAPTKSRQILALLLCAPGQVVLVDQIIKAMWGEHVPQTPAGLVRNYIMKLRRGLDADTEIVTRSGGYQLQVDPATVDAVCFERCFARARQAQDRVLAEKLLDEALSLWHGPALADVRRNFALELEAVRLEGLRLSAKQLRAELLLERGSFVDVVSELQPLVAVNPDRERLFELTMVALARDGRPAEALDAYARFRYYQRTELGLDPSDRMAALQQAVLRGQAGQWEISTRRQLNGEQSRIR